MYSGIGKRKDQMSTWLCAWYEMPALKKFDKMLLISNDSDLVGTVAMVVNEFGIPVFQASPNITINKAFIGVASHSFVIQPDRLRKCILPPSITCADGTIVTCPREWS